jgi:hypothetical protein
MHGMEGAKTYKWIIGDHLQRCAAATEILLRNKMGSSWVRSWAMMIIMLEATAYPYLKHDEEYTTRREERLRNDQNQVTETNGSVSVAYLMDLVARYQAVLDALHRNGVIHPRDTPTEDARAWFLRHIGLDPTHMANGQQGETSNKEIPAPTSTV